MNESGSGNSIKQFTYGEGKLATATRHNRLAELGDIVTTETNQYAGVGGLSHRDTVIGSTGAFNGAAFSFEQSWTTSGEPKTITYPATTQVGRTLTVGLEFTRGLLTHVYPCTISGSLCTATGEYGWMTYSADGRVSTVSHGNGVVDSMAPDPNGLPRPLSIGSGYGGSEYWWSGTYGYDGSGSIKRSDRSTVTHLDRTDYSYDVFGRLVRWNTAGDGGGVLVGCSRVRHVRQLSLRCGGVLWCAPQRHRRNPAEGAAFCPPRSSGRRTTTSASPMTTRGI